MLDPRSLLARPAVYRFFQDIVGGNAARKRFIESRIALFPGIRILEIGCGPGTIVEFLPAYADYTGCDISERYIGMAKEKYGNRAAFFHVPVGEIKSLNLKPFDLVLAIGVLHHLDDSLVLSLCREARGLMTQNGLFVSALDPYLDARGTWFRRAVAKMDRGEHVRQKHEYASLVGEYFSQVTVAEQDCSDIRLPSNGCVITAGA